MLCFIHIERAGGTTLHKVLINNYYLKYLVLTPWYYWTDEDQNTLKKEELHQLLTYLPTVEAFGGHNVRSYHDYQAVCPTIEYITFLRDPVKRYISHYQYQVNVMKKKWTIESFLDNSRFDNFMTKRIIGSYDVEKAKKHLQQDYAFVGLTDQFEESLLLMKQKLNVPSFNIYYERRNAARDNRLKDTIINDETIIAEIKARNNLDQKLYDYVKQTLFQKQERKKSFQNLLQDYKQHNAHYRFPILKNSMYNFFRYSYYRNVDLLINKILKDT